MTVTQDSGAPPRSGVVRRVLAMIIAARQRRVLTTIECMLRRTDPRLASKFGMFSRLTTGEEMPWIEQVTSSRPRRRGSMTRLGQLSYRLRVVLFVGVAASALATALLAGGGALARRAPVKAVQDHSLQSGAAAARATHLARSAAAQGLMAGPHGLGHGAIDLFGHQILYVAEIPAGYSPRPAWTSPG